MGADAMHDLVVLGGGSAGYATAIRARELGLSVGLVEEDRVGGTCLHRGCVPTKAMLHVAEVADAVRGASQLGVDAGLNGIDLGRAHEFRDRIVAKKFTGLQGLLRARGVEVISGRGTLTAEGTVTVGADTLRATDVVLATGARTRWVPGTAAGPRVLSSESALELDHVPTSAIVLGGGVIGVEFASLWRSLGAEVTVVEALDRLLPAEDPVISAGVARAFRKRGIATTFGSALSELTERDDAVEATLADGSTLTAEVILVAVGREPRTEGFAEAGVELDRGFVRTDSTLRTTLPHVWAVGDIVHGPQLAHRGFQQGIFVAEAIAGLSPRAVADREIPRIVYSDPEVASVGATQAQAEAEWGADSIRSFEYNLAGNARTEILGQGGLVKVIRVVDGPVVGVHMVGPGVGELISQAQLVVGWEAHPEDVAPYLLPHPTQSEALGEAYLALAGRPLHTV